MLSAIIGLIAIQSNKINVCPEGDFKRSKEACDSFLEIERMDEKAPKNRGIKMFAVNETQTQIAIIPYTEERIYIYDGDGNYQFSIKYPSVNTSYFIRYIGNTLEIIYVHKENKIIRIDCNGDIIACEGLLKEQDSDLLRYYENRKRIQINEGTYYSTSPNIILDFFGLHSKIIKSTEGSEVCVYGNSDSELWIVLYGAIKGLFIWGLFGAFIFFFPFVCINAELVKSYIKYMGKK